MKQEIAKIISFILHPVVFALLIPFLFVYQQSSNFFYSLKWVFFSSFFLFLLSLGFYFVRPKEFFKDFDISQKEQRHIFYSLSLLVSVLYFISAILFKGILFPLSIVSLGIILGIVLLDIANYYMKVSIHMAVASAFTVTIAMLFGLSAFFTFVWILPLMAWSRISMHKHNEKEILAGMFLGTGVTLATFLVGRSLLL